MKKNLEDGVPMSSIFDYVDRGTRKQLVDYIYGNPENKSKINIQDTNGNTALHIALKKAQKDHATVLLTAGADFYIKNKQNETAFEIAANSCMKDMLELMSRMDYLRKNPPKNVKPALAKEFENSTKNLVNRGLDKVTIDVSKEEISQLVRDLLFNDVVGERILINSFLSIHSAFFHAMQTKNNAVGSDISRIIMDETKNVERFENMVLFNIFEETFEDLLDAKAMDKINIIRASQVIKNKVPPKKPKASPVRYIKENGKVVKNTKTKSKKTKRK